jgi:TatD DNase family protein
MFTDTHTHLYLDAFSEDRREMIQRALEAGVHRMLLPNIDSQSIQALTSLCQSYPGRCFPMMGLHPTSVKEDYRKELEIVRRNLDKQDWVAIGECGIDLYWDATYLEAQEEVFRAQIGWARSLGLPLVIHARDSFPELFRILDEEQDGALTGVFHSFTGTRKDLDQALSYGFYIGINGIVTFKNSGLANVVQALPPERLLLETDAPFLAPAPHRGRRNESSYLVHVAAKVAEIFNLSLQELADLTSRNAENLFPKILTHGG